MRLCTSIQVFIYCICTVCVQDISYEDKLIIICIRTTCDFAAKSRVVVVHVTKEFESTTKEIRPGDRCCCVQHR